jgi:hypothetical protein
MRMTKALLCTMKSFARLGISLVRIKKYQSVLKRFLVYVLVFLAFLSGIARKNQPILVLELFASEARIKPSIQYRNMIFIGDLD